VDLAGQPVAGWTVDLAGRYEHFSDFGNAKVGKLTSRYDFSPVVGVRATYSNGFRAPTLAEEYYSATNVSPRSAFVQLAPNSPGAKLVGVNGLRPEASTNISAGIVINPSAVAAITLDAYQITIRDRIVGSGSLYGSGGAVNSPAVTAAIIANGNVLDPTVVQTGINIFSNAVNTRSRGLEFVATLNSSYGAYGKVDWSLAANYNKVEVIKINQAPAQLQPQTLLDATAISDLETASPRVRVNLGALWKSGPWTVNAREAFYGKRVGTAVVGRRHVLQDGSQADGDHGPGSQLPVHEGVDAVGGGEQFVQPVPGPRQRKPPGRAARKPRQRRRHRVSVVLAVRH
jgi:iron complex outermembrane receptor protein